MTPIIVISVLLGLGILFLMIEIFFLPGISIAGIVGALFIASAIIYAYVDVGSTAGTLTLVGGLTFLAFAVWQFMKSKTLDRMALKVDITEKVEPLKGIEVKPGDEGKTVSRLAPMGKIRINGAIVEAKTSDSFIDENQSVVVLEVFNNNVLVEQKTPNL